MRFRYTPLLLAAMIAGMALAGTGLRGATRPVSCPKPPAGQAGGRISGKVLDNASNAPIASAQVLIENARCATITDEKGEFRFAAPFAAGTHRLRIARLGYVAKHQQVVVRNGVDTTLTVRLGAAALQLEHVVTTSANASALYGAAAGSPPIAISSRLAKEIETADALLVIDGTPLAAESRMLRRDGANAQSAGAATDSVVEPPATQGTLRARARDGKPLADFPLQHTNVAAEISGAFARTVVEQRYANPYAEVIEAVYIFPLPVSGAVNDFVMRVGGRKIVGLIRTREDAERIYRDARARGQTASLLTQERPNIFTQNVANIEPGGTVTISITYFERLPYEKGEYEFVFPMVVGPRYNPSGTAQPLLVANPGNGVPREEPRRPFGGGGCAAVALRADTTSVNPPVLAPGQRSGHDISLSVTLDAGLPIAQLAAIAHQVEIDRVSPTRQVIRLAKGDAIPNRDFVLRWSVAGAETRFGVLAHGARGKGWFSLTMQPPTSPSDEQVTPREITFIMDVSGSMMGVPISLSKELVERTLDRLRPDDHFNLVYFAGGNAQLWERARRNTPENVAEAKRFLSSLRAGGGTEMLAGVRRALAAHHEPELIQMYVFLTDGYVGNEEQILEVLKTERGDARFFGFGIGGSVNRYLIDGIGEHGGGMSQVVIPRDSAHASRSVGRLFDAIDSPVLVDIAIDWNGLPVRDAYPLKVRDLFAGQVIDVVGRYDGTATGTAYVTGRVGARRVRYPVSVELPSDESRHAALAPIWARRKIHELSGVMLDADSSARKELRSEITALALEHRLVSRYTAFVAVDSSRIVGNGDPLRVMQPVELPEGVSYEGIFGEKPAGRPVRIDAWGMTLQETESGKVRIADLAPGGAAAKAGLTRGAQLTSVDDFPIASLAELEGRLLQSSSDQVALRTAATGEVRLGRP